jgi:hypothetical protein
MLKMNDEVKNIRNHASAGHDVEFVGVVFDE